MNRTDLEMTIPMTPRGKPRHRTMKGGRTYPDPKGVKWEEEFAWHVRAMIGRAMLRFAPGSPLRLEVIAYFQRTKDEEMVYKKTGEPKHPTDALPNAKKPDFDNVAKIVGDALNAIVWHDDQQIVDGTILTAKVPLGENPNVWFRVEEQTQEQFAARICSIRGGVR